MFADAGVNIHEATLTTCYIGMTACMPALAAEKCGASADNFNVYIVSLETLLLSIIRSITGI